MYSRGTSENTPTSTNGINGTTSGNTASGSALPAFSHPHSGIRTPPNGMISPHGSPFPMHAHPIASNSSSSSSNNNQYASHPLSHHHHPHPHHHHHHHSHSHLPHYNSHSLSRSSSVALSNWNSPAATPSMRSASAGIKGEGQEDDENDDDDDEEDEDEDDDDEDEEDEDDDEEEDDNGNESASQSSSVSDSSRPRKRKRDKHNQSTSSNRNASTAAQANNSSVSSPSSNNNNANSSAAANISTATGKPKPPRGSKACTHCRKLKMRCTGGENGPPCDRCKHSGYTCIFEESNRGKKAAANAAAAAKAKAEKQQALAAAKAAAAAAAAAAQANPNNPSNTHNSASSPSNPPPSLMAGFPSSSIKTKGKGKQSNQDLARSLEKMEATLNTVLRTMRDPAHASSLGHASGMLTRPHSPARDDDSERKRRKQQNSSNNSSSSNDLPPPPTTIDPTQVHSTTQHHPSTTNMGPTHPFALPTSSASSHAARYATMAPQVAYQGQVPGVGIGSGNDVAAAARYPAAGHSSSSASRRPPSPRLHSLPPDSLNPLGLLAEASLGNQISSARRTASGAGTASSHSAGSRTRGGSQASHAPSGSGRAASAGAHSTPAGASSASHRSSSHGPTDHNANDPTAAVAETGPEEEEAIQKGSWSAMDTPALGVASKAYFRPGPMSMLPLRKVIIDRELPPELLTSGIVSDAEVLDLFSIFFHNCAQHIILLDPEWHTPQFVCGRSPFLFTVILAIASRYYAPRPDLHTKCLQQATKEAFRCLEKGFKSIEIVQAFLLLTMWGQPARRFEEDKSWIFAGIAFRVATDLNLHRKSAAHHQSQQQNKEPTNDPVLLEREKEIRNRERTWIFCFVVDRSLSSQMGKPSVIREDFIIRNTRSWALERSAAMSDVALGALTDLLRLTSRQMELLYSSTTSVTGLNSDLDFSAMIKIFHEQMEEWRGFWQARGLVIGDCRNRQPRVPEPDDTMSVRETELIQIYSAANRPEPPPDDADHTMRTLYFLIQQAPLRYHYASLVIHSFGLQFGSSMDRGAYFYRCYDAAKGVYFAARDGMRPVLRYAPDTQILIISFALIFMLKLTRPTFSNYADSEEIFKLVEEGADMLEEVAAGPSHTPALYGHFIRSTLNHAKLSRGSNDGTNGYPSRATSPTPQGHQQFNGENAGQGATAASAFEMPNSGMDDPMLGGGVAGTTSGRATRRNSMMNHLQQQSQQPSSQQQQPQQNGNLDSSNVFNQLNQFLANSGNTGGNMSGSGYPSFPNSLQLGGGGGNGGGGSLGFMPSGNTDSVPPSTGASGYNGLYSTASNSDVATNSFMLDNVWWNQLVPAGLGGPLDGLNGGIDMQPLHHQSQNPTTTSSSYQPSSMTLPYSTSSSFSIPANDMTGFGSIVGMGLDLSATLGLDKDTSSTAVVGTGVTRPNSPHTHTSHVRFNEEKEEKGELKDKGEKSEEKMDEKEEDKGASEEKKDTE
ncbi:unnamed protein product [Sympodiomycopsis kandeliae]